jgi:hypothetical protein
MVAIAGLALGVLCGTAFYAAWSPVDSVVYRWGVDEVGAFRQGFVTVVCFVLVPYCVMMLVVKYIGPRFTK